MALTRCRFTLTTVTPWTGSWRFPTTSRTERGVTIRIWAAGDGEERVLALGSKLGRGLWSQGELPEFARSAPKPVAPLGFGETVAVLVSCNAFELQDETFVVPTDHTGRLTLSSAKLNGLVSNVSGNAMVRTGTTEGEIQLSVSLSDHAPPISSPADLEGLGIALGPRDDSVLVSHETSGSIRLIGPEVSYRLAPLDPGRYAMLVVARDRDSAERASRRRSRKRPAKLEEVLVVMWPDPDHEVPNELVLQSVSQFDQSITEYIMKTREQIRREAEFYHQHPEWIPSAKSGD